MKKLNRQKISEIIKNEIKKIVDEEILLDPPSPEDPNYYRYYNREEEYEDDEIPHVFESGCGPKIKHSKVSDLATPGEAVGIGYKIGKHHKSGAYMAKKQMFKVAKYASEIYHMIPDGHNLEDWMRTKLAQISDDISEVYHALDYRDHKGEI